MDCDIYHRTGRPSTPRTTHANATLTRAGRLAPARCVIDGQWPLRRAAERFQVSRTTARRWAERYRTLGQAGMVDASSRPHHSPRRTPTRRERRVIKLRCTRRWGRARIGGHPGMRPSTVHRILTRYRMPRLSHLDQGKQTAVGFGERAHAHFASVGITVERVLTDNGSCYTSRAWRDALADRGIKHKRTRP